MVESFSKTIFPRNAWWKHCSDGWNRGFRVIQTKSEKYIILIYLNKFEEKCVRLEMVGHFIKIIHLIRTPISNSNCSNLENKEFRSKQKSKMEIKRLRIWPIVCAISLVLCIKIHRSSESVFWFHMTIVNNCHSSTSLGERIVALSIDTKILATSIGNRRFCDSRPWCKYLI